MSSNPKRPKATTAEAAAYAGLRPNYLDKLRCIGGGPTYIKMNGTIRYDYDDLDAWLEARKRISTSGEFKGTGRGRKPSKVTEVAA